MNNKEARDNLKKIIHNNNLTAGQQKELFTLSDATLAVYMCNGQRDIPKWLRLLLGIYVNIIENNGFDGFITYCKNNNLIVGNFEEL